MRRAGEQAARSTFRMRRVVWLVLVLVLVLGRALLACRSQPASEVDRAGGLALTVTDESGAPLSALLTLRGKDGVSLPIYSTQASLSEIAPGVFGMADGLAVLGGAATVPVPPGRWQVTVSHGPAYEISVQDLEIPAGGAPVPLAVTLERAVDTTGYLAADLHVHAVRSPDSTAPLDGRVVAAAVAGLDVLGSADHNSETDYAPAIAALGLQGRVASIVGNEISLDWSHFSAYPLRYRAEEPLGGAPPIETLAENLATPADVFAYVRGQPTQPVIQVNHPRFEAPASYFYVFGFDAASCAAKAPFSYDFDVVEVLNGMAVREPYLSAVMADWLCLVGSGRPVTATGNSDSHGVRRLSPGYPRNWVYTGDDDASTWDEARFMQALREHRVLVSTAPFVTIEAAGARVGELARPTGGTLPVRVVVQAPSWVQVDKVRLIAGGDVVTELDVPAAGRPRLDQVVELPVDHDTYVLAMAWSDTLLRQDVVGELEMPPFAFTNPIYVDADGDGEYTPLRRPPAQPRTPRAPGTPREPGAPGAPGTPSAPRAPGAPQPSVVPPLRAFAGTGWADECSYELDSPR